MDKCDKHPFKAVVGICAYCVTELLLDHRVPGEVESKQSNKESDDEWRSALSDEEECSRNSFEVDKIYNSESFRSILSGKGYEVTTLNWRSSSNASASTILQTEKENGHHSSGVTRSSLLSYLCCRNMREKTVKSFSKNLVQGPESHLGSDDYIHVSSYNEKELNSSSSTQGSSLKQLFQRDEVQGSSLRQMLKRDEMCSTSPLSEFMKDARDYANRQEGVKRSAKLNKKGRRMKILLPSNRVERGSMLRVFLAPFPVGLFTKKKRRNVLKK